MSKVLGLVEPVANKLPLPLSSSQEVPCLKHIMVSRNFMLSECNCFLIFFMMAVKTLKHVECSAYKDIGFLWCLLAAFDLFKYNIFFIQ